METENIHLMLMAKESLKGKWGLAIGTFVVYIFITSILQSIKGIGPIISLVISGPFALGLAIFSLSLSRNQDAKLRQIFQGFNNFKTTLHAYLLITLYVILWLLLLIVPGIMVALSYAMTFYILADDNTLTARQAMSKSKDMMCGHKLKLLNLCFRFLGLALLCILTLGIGFLWLIPYIQVSTAKFYDDMKETYLKERSLYSNQ